MLCRVGLAPCAHGKTALGKSGLVVSEMCLGTMTFGLQADKKTAFRVMDRSIEAGINFFDTAEVYPVPPSVELAGNTEDIVGRWLKARPRESVIIASKIAGAAHGWFNPPVRHGTAALDRLSDLRGQFSGVARWGRAD